MDQLKTVIETNSRMTVFRKMAKIGYISSCSHSGKFYALKKTARFNKYGIWRYNSILFSKHGTLKSTLKVLIEDSSKGFTAGELSKLLKIKVEDCLGILTKEKAIVRKKVSGVYVYFSRHSKSKTKQELTRTDSIQSVDTYQDIITDELKAALIIFFSTLDEKQRRLYAGYESMKIGRGGDKLIADILNLDRKTVAKGRKELISGEVNLRTTRSLGGGRKQVKKNSECD